MRQLDFAVYISYMVSTKEINAHAGKPSRDVLHPDYVPTKFNATDKADKQLKRFERHVKRDVAVVNVRRFVLLVDNWTQTGARPPMIDHATQTGFPALLDAETQTGEYTVQDVEVHARTATKPIARRK